MSYATERIRDAREAMRTGNYRRVVQICEQVRATEKPTDAQLAELFGLLGRAHGALGDHETALTFLKRADRAPETEAAARAAYHELGLDGSSGDVFEIADARQRQRRRKRIGWVVGALISVPVLGGCCFCMTGNVWMALLYPALWGPDMDRYQAAQQAGVEAGRSGTIAMCEELLVSELAQCTADDVNDDDATWGACISATGTFQGCLSTATGWDAYCTEVPPPYPQRAATEWLQRRCDAHAAEMGISGVRAETLSDTCITSLSAVPMYCADPEMRPRDEGPE